ncbi:hypothetical protein C0J52_08745 [Blattella germanica]|nr:hypothetical protein C0J52_08745 [Blattella germanica]
MKVKLAVNSSIVPELSLTMCFQLKIHYDSKPKILISKLWIMERCRISFKVGFSLYDIDFK